MLLISHVLIHNLITFNCRHLYPDKKENLDKLRLHLLESSNEMAPLKVWQVQELSLQAAERIMNSPKEEALKVLTNIAQNFPLQVSEFSGTFAFLLAGKGC
jgi:UDP-glucose:glycoprotein glucosyltransferase